MLSYFDGFFSLADAALKDSIDKANKLFGLFGGVPDRAVHAMNTRYLLKLFLSGRGVAAEEEKSPEEGLDHQQAGVSLEWVANCGVFVRLPEADVRILKPGPSGVPKSTSAARSRYYSSNQMLLAFAKNGHGHGGTADLPLTLVLLWDVDDQFKYVSLEVACPRMTRKDGSVDCFWIAKWEGGAGAASSRTAPSDAPVTDLDEITPKQSRAASAGLKS